MGDDIIKHFVRRLSAYAPPEEVQRVELELRQHWGGVRVYVTKERPAPKMRAFAGSLAAGAGLREASEAAGVSLRQGYRYAGMRLRRP